MTDQEYKDYINQPRVKVRRIKAAKNHQLKKRYGIDLEQYEILWKIQEGRCSICHKTEAEATKSGFRLSVDHDHATGKIRSLLCISCNGVLGQSKDNPVRLLECVAYLKSHGIEP